MSSRPPNPRRSVHLFDRASRLVCQPEPCVDFLAAETDWCADIRCLLGYLQLEVERWRQHPHPDERHRLIHALRQAVLSLSYLMRTLDIQDADILWQRDNLDRLVGLTLTELEPGASPASPAPTLN